MVVDGVINKMVMWSNKKRLYIFCRHYKLGLTSHQLCKGYMATFHKAVKYFDQMFKIKKNLKNMMYRVMLNE